MDAISTIRSSCAQRVSNTSRSVGAESESLMPRATREAPASMTTARFSQWAPRVRTTRVLIAGDVMLDRYWFGEVERISPEAPVPVVKIARSEERPGGAANVARNAHSLGAQATLLSVTGADEAGSALARLLDAEGVRTSFHRDPSVTTT